MWLRVVIFVGFLQGILGSQIACLDMIPMDVSKYQDGEMPYEVKNSVNFHMKIQCFKLGKKFVKTQRYTKI